MATAPGNVHFTYAQLESIWIQAGGSRQAAPMAAAIAMAESGGNSTAYLVDSNGSTDRGLWQINSVHGAQSTFDIMGNARAAVAISSNGSNWRPWTTYNTGAYRQYLQGGVAPDNNVPINATNAAAARPGGTGNQAQLTSQQLITCGSCINPSNWACCFFGNAANSIAGPILSTIVNQVLDPIVTAIVGIIGMTSGGTLMLLGMFLVFKSTETGQQVIGGATQLAGMFAGPEGAAMTGGERAALITQQTARERAAARQTLQGTTAAAQRASQQERIAARERAATRSTRTRVTRTQEGNVTTYTTTREQINGEAQEYRAREQGRNPYPRAIEAQAGPAVRGGRPTGTYTRRTRT